MANTIIESRIAASSDDAEEKLSTGGVTRSSSDLEMTTDGAVDQMVGLRFTGLDIPPDAVIINAYIQFTVDEVSTGTASLAIGGELSDNAQKFKNIDGNITSRPDTAATASWAPPDWTTVGASGTDQQTSDISAVIQEIVDQSDWTQGNALVLNISGSGTRTAESFNGSPENAPLLHIEYALPTNGVPTIDLDGDDSSGATGADFATAFVAQGDPVAIADADAVAAGGTLVSARITITNSAAGDVLSASGLPAGITVDQANSTATSLILIGDATPADYATAIQAITFDTAATPVPGDRMIEVTVNDGTTDSAIATTTVTVSSGNAAPVATADEVDATSGTPLVITASQLTGNDSDADGDTLTITAVTDPANGTAVLDPDGTITYTSTPGYSGSDSFAYTISDGNGGTASATVTVDVVADPDPVQPDPAQPGPIQIVESRIAASSDDAEEKTASNAVNRTSSDLELSNDGSTNQLIGLRFTGLEIPPDAVIVNAHIQFTVDEVSTGAASLLIGGELAADAQAFVSVAGNISSRLDTTASVAWTPPEWTTVGASGTDQQTSDISAVIQEIVDQSGWTQGGALALTISGTGRRTAESYNGSKTNAPLLHVEYTVPAAGGAPTVDLDGDDSSGATGADFATTLVAQGAAVAIADADAVVSDSEGNLISARITITSSETGDVLAAGSLPFGITVDQTNSTAATLILIGDATPADYASAIQAITFDTSATPVLGDRTIEVTVNDGTTDSAIATTTVTVSSGNAAPEAMPDVFDTAAGTPLVISASELTGNDNDADGDTLTITAVSETAPAGAAPTNGTAVLNPDGTITYTSAPGYGGTDSFEYTVSDGNGGTATATVTIDVVDVVETGPVQIIESRIAASSDDAEEKTTSSAVNRTSSDIELADDGSTNQLIGLRFTNLDIPPDAVITNAYVQFTVDEVSTGTASLMIGGELAADAQTFVSVAGNISLRQDTTASVAWTPPDWTTVGASGSDQQTADISAVIQEIIDQSGWIQGGALALTISGTGRRTAESYNGSKANAPLLHVEYAVPAADGVPSVDLDGDNSSGESGADFATAFVAEGAAVAIGDSDTVVTDSDGNLTSARITITNSETGDVLAAGGLPSGISVDQINSTANTLVLIGDATPSDYAAAIQTITFDTSATPVLGDRTIEVTLNDGTTDSAIATTTVTVSSGNTPPVATPDGFDATAGTPLVITASQLTGNDDDADGDALTINAVTDPANGTAVLNADGNITYTSAPGYDGADSFDYTISDGKGGTASATVTVAVDAADAIDANPVQTVESRISAASDDAEEDVTSGEVSLKSSDLELATDLSNNQLVGMRFTGLDIPTDAVILSAHIQFTVDEVSDGATSLIISGEDSDDAQTFSSLDGDISSRPTTDASVTWTPPDWTKVGDSGIDQQTADIAIVIQEIVDRPGWTPGSALALTISNIGELVAESYNGSKSGAPLLHIEYEVPTDGIPRIDLDHDNGSGASGRDFATAFVVNGAPVAIADTDRVITDSNGATLTSASITITNPEAGDALVVGALTGGIVANLEHFPIILGHILS